MEFHVEESLRRSSAFAGAVVRHASSRLDQLLDSDRKQVALERGILSNGADCAEKSAGNAMLDGVERVIVCWGAVASGEDKRDGAILTEALAALAPQIEAVHKLLPPAR